MVFPAPRLVFAYRPDGFQLLGGLRRIAEEAVVYFSEQYPRLELMTFSDVPQGNLAGTNTCTQLRRNDQLLIIGCDSPWAYVLALRAKCRGLSVAWLPSFHDPNYTLHPFRARIAQAALRLVQWFGVVVYAQTEHELHLLRVSWLSSCLLSGHGYPGYIRKQIKRLSVDSAFPYRSSSRPVDLLFLGRPTEQKGWSCFVSIAQMCNLRCEAVVPFMPNFTHDIKIHCGLTDDSVFEILRKTKILIVPSIYESFGIAQLEALLAGCVVPVLGSWPLWQDFNILQWQSLETDAIGCHCNALAADPEMLHALWRQQILYVAGHPTLFCPLFPGLQCVNR